MSHLSSNPNLQYRATEGQLQVAPAPLPPTGDGAHDGSSRRNPLQVIWLRRWIVAGTVMLALAVGVVMLLRATPIYKSDAQLTVEQSGPKIIANDPNGMMMGTNNYLYTECRRLVSREILATVASMPAVRDLETFRGGDVTNVVGYLKQTVSANVGRRDDIITVTAKSPHADDAAVIANSVVDAYKAYHDSKRRSSAQFSIELLNENKDKRSKELADLYKKRLAFQRSN